MDLEQTIWQLRVAGADIVAIDGDQNEVPRKHHEHVQELEQFRYCTEQNLAEITEKLNSLIGYVGGWKPDAARFSHDRTVCKNCGADPRSADGPLAGLPV